MHNHDATRVVASLSTRVVAVSSARQACSRFRLFRVGNLQQQTPERSAPSDRLAEVLQWPVESAADMGESVGRRKLVSMSHIIFRPLTREDIGTLAAWFGEPDIAEWWHAPNDSQEFEAKYVARIEGEDPTDVWVIEVDGVAAGFAQSYRHADHPDHDALVGIPNAVGIDYLLGGNHRGRALGVQMLSALAEFVVSLHSHVSVCVATPDERNVRSRGALEAAGFIYSHRSEPLGGPAKAVYVWTQDRL